MKYFFYTLLCGILFCTQTTIASVSTATSGDMRTVGDTTNPTTIYIFSSLTCPHCADFHKTILPQIKSQFVDTGKAKIIFVDMPYDGRAMAGTLISRCLSADNYAGFMAHLYDKQADWGYSADAKSFLFQAAQAFGLPETAVNTCLADKDLQKKIIEQRNNLSGLYKVRGMPTTVLVKNGTAKNFVGADESAILNGLTKELN